MALRINEVTRSTSAEWIMSSLPIFAEFGLPMMEEQSTSTTTTEQYTPADYLAWKAADYLQLKGVMTAQGRVGW